MLPFVVPTPDLTHYEAPRATGCKERRRSAPTGIEEMFAEEARYFATLDGPYPPDMDRMKAITEPYGVRLLGPPLTQ